MTGSEQGAVEAAGVMAVAGKAAEMEVVGRVAVATEAAVMVAVARVVVAWAVVERAAAEMVVAVREVAVRAAVRAEAVREEGATVAAVRVAGVTAVAVRAAVTVAAVTVTVEEVTVEEVTVEEATVEEATVEEVRAAGVSRPSPSPSPSQSHCRPHPGQHRPDLPGQQLGAGAEPTGHPLRAAAVTGCQGAWTHWQGHRSAAGACPPCFLPLAPPRLNPEVCLHLRRVPCCARIQNGSAATACQPTIAVLSRSWVRWGPIAPARPRTRADLRSRWELGPQRPSEGSSALFRLPRMATSRFFHQLSPLARANAAPRG